LTGVRCPVIEQKNDAIVNAASWEHREMVLIKSNKVGVKPASLIAPKADQRAVQS
jgi:hypothetical protein